MARGDKNYTEVVRKVNSGQSANAKIAAIHAMVEALIQEDNDEAVEQLRNYLQLKSRQILLGEDDVTFNPASQRDIAFVFQLHLPGDGR